MKKMTLFLAILLASTVGYSQSRQFNQYQPVIDPEVYRQLLEQNDKEYQSEFNARKEALDNINTQTAILIKKIDDDNAFKRIRKQYNDFILDQQQSGYNIMDNGVFKWLVDCYTTIQKNAINAIN